MDVKVKVSCEDPDTVYICLPDVRLIFHEGEYVGFRQDGEEE